MVCGVTCKETKTTKIVGRDFLCYLSFLACPATAGSVPVSRANDRKKYECRMLNVEGVNRFFFDSFPKQARMLVLLSVRFREFPWLFFSVVRMFCGF